jgi:hypothetical protein
MHRQTIQLGICIVALAVSAAAQTNVTNSNDGATNKVPVYTGSATLGNSPISVWGGTNVGIGITNPGYALTVTGSVYATVGLKTIGDTELLGSSGTGSLRLAIQGSDNAYIQAGTSTTDTSAILNISRWNASTSTISKFNVYSDNSYFSGNLGIGTTAPAAKADIYVSNGVGLKVEGNSGSFQGADINIIRSTATNAVGYAPTLQFNDGTAGGASIIQEYQGQTQFWNIDGGSWLQTATILPSGHVGIGTTSPAYLLDVAGTIRTSSGGVVYPDGSSQTTAWTGVLCGGDYAESVDVTGDRTNYGPGDVLVIDPDHPGKFLKSAEPYSTSVTGVYSTKPGVQGRRQKTLKSDDEVPMAMIGIVPTKVSAENGPIRPGDLLVASSTLGYAMKGTDRSRMMGAVIGKALNSLDSGTGVIEVVVTLQ